jgi:DMSO/TMAO reductase YedYZ molybdopterin-dependent catalytic subunit
VFPASSPDNHTLSPECFVRRRRIFALARPGVSASSVKRVSFSLAEIRSFPRRSQITMIACEEGWSYIAEWSGVPLSYILDRVGVHPQARYVVYRSIQPDWWESIDMAVALHPQTTVAHAMNGGELSAPFGGPLRMRVPRQLGYKSLKYINRLTLTGNIKQFGKGWVPLSRKLGTRGTPVSDSSECQRTGR